VCGVIQIQSLSKRAQNILRRSELGDISDSLYSIKDTDPIWSEILEYLYSGDSFFVIDEEMTIQEKAEIVRKELTSKRKSCGY